MSSSELVQQFARMDASGRARLEAGCNFINDKIARLRRRVFTVSGIAGGAALLVIMATGIDVRFPLALAAVAVIITFALAQRELARWYKKMVIQRVVEALGPGLTYQPGSGFTRDEFRAINLFQSRIDQWKSEDQINGARQNVSFALHEVRAARRE